VPTCLNCHSFSRDGKTMGIDLDGPNNDKGLYALTPISRRISIENRNVVQWNTDGRVGKTRVGFMSQVSPDGRYVVSTFAPPSLDFPQSYYTVNFKTIAPPGLLSHQGNSAVVIAEPPVAVCPCPAPMIRTLCRPAESGAPTASGSSSPAPSHANHVCPGSPSAARQRSNETQIQYDLYRIPFNDGRGGRRNRSRARRKTV